LRCASPTLWEKKKCGLPKGRNGEIWSKGTETRGTAVANRRGLSPQALREGGEGWRGGGKGDRASALESAQAS